MSPAVPGHRRPEILAPAGDPESLRAAVRAGADAVYFGLPGFNARARATNFDEASLHETMRALHERGAKGYVTLNTLLFDAELSAFEAAVRACASAGVDAVIVQDLGATRLVRALAPTLPIHASTQMTCTDAGSVAFAEELGASRVILARELSIADIEKVRAESAMELEVFVHGALCVAYSGQCMTSEAIGGRSANRGACAQACRLEYELFVDGEKRDVDGRAYLLSPEDLEASSLVPELARLGVSSLKIEGRLKGPEYVAATTRLYREAVAALGGDAASPSRETKADALQMFSRGSGPGFLGGVDHQRLVEGRGCDHRGLLLGQSQGVRRARGKACLALTLDEPLARGDGLLVEGGFGGQGELGGRVWSISLRGNDVEAAPAGAEVVVWLGPDKALSGALEGRRVFKTSDPVREKSIRERTEREAVRLPVSIRVSGAFGELPVFEARAGEGPKVTVTGDAVVERARSAGDLSAALRDKLGRLGDTPFSLGELEVALPEGALVPSSSLNRARRSLVEALLATADRSHATTPVTAASLVERARPPARPAPAPGLFVLCRTQAQAEAALDAGAAGVYLDFLELTGTGAALRALRARGASHVGVAPPRIRKPGEEKIDRYLRALEPDSILVRGLGALREVTPGIPHVGDFSLNVTNRLTAALVLEKGLAAFTPAFDLDSSQLVGLLDSPFGPFAEVVLHHPMPLFHMEHCVIAALLSEGKDHLTCGRPCEHHQVSLKDRAGMLHPVEADVGCRNTVFHEKAQSAADLVPALRKGGVGRFRIELVREGPGEVHRLVGAYRKLLEGSMLPSELWHALKTEAGYGVVRGSLRVLSGA